MTMSQYEAFQATTLKVGDIYYGDNGRWYRVAHITRFVSGHVVVRHEDGTTAKFPRLKQVVVTHDADDPSTPPAVDSEFVGL